MKRENVWVGAWALLFCLLGTAVAWAQSQPQPSLADVAKHKPAAKAKRVITNEDIPPSPEASPAPPAASADSAAIPASDGKPAAEKNQGTAASSTEKEAGLPELTKEQQNLEKIIVILQQQIESTDDHNRIATLNGIVQHAKEQLAETQRKIDKLKAGGGGAAQADGSPAAGSQGPPPQAPPK